MEIITNQSRIHQAEQQQTAQLKSDDDAMVEECEQLIDVATESNQLSALKEMLAIVLRHQTRESLDHQMIDWIVENVNDDEHPIALDRLSLLLGTGDASEQGLLEYFCHRFMSQPLMSKSIYGIHSDSHTDTIPSVNTHTNAIHSIHTYTNENHLVNANESRILQWLVSYSLSTDDTSLIPNDLNRLTVWMQMLIACTESHNNGMIEKILYSLSSNGQKNSIQQSFLRMLLTNLLANRIKAQVNNEETACTDGVDEHCDKHLNEECNPIAMNQRGMDEKGISSLAMVDWNQFNGHPLFISNSNPFIFMMKYMLGKNETLDAILAEILANVNCLVSSGDAVQSMDAEVQSEEVLVNEILVSIESEYSSLAKDRTASSTGVSQHALSSYMPNGLFSLQSVKVLMFLLKHRSFKSVTQLIHAIQSRTNQLAINGQTTDSQFNSKHMHGVLMDAIAPVVIDRFPVKLMQCIMNANSQSPKIQMLCHYMMPWIIANKDNSIACHVIHLVTVLREQINNQSTEAMDNQMTVNQNVYLQRMRQCMEWFRMIEESTQIQSIDSSSAVGQLKDCLLEWFSGWTADWLAQVPLTRQQRRHALVLSSHDGEESTPIESTLVDGMMDEPMVIDGHRIPYCLSVLHISYFDLNLDYMARYALNAVSTGNTVNTVITPTSAPLPVALRNDAFVGMMDAVSYIISCPNSLPHLAINRHKLFTRIRSEEVEQVFCAVMQLPESHNINGTLDSMVNWREELMMAVLAVRMLHPQWRDISVDLRMWTHSSNTAQESYNGQGIKDEHQSNTSHESITSQDIIDEHHSSTVHQSYNGASVARVVIRVVQLMYGPSVLQAMIQDLQSFSDDGCHYSLMAKAIVEQNQLMLRQQEEITQIQVQQRQQERQREWERERIARMQERLRQLASIADELQRRYREEQQ